LAELHIELKDFERTHGCEQGTVLSNCAHNSATAAKWKIMMVYTCCYRMSVPDPLSLILKSGIVARRLVNGCFLPVFLLPDRPSGSDASTVRLLNNLWRIVLQG
jgi:hypothetical protein